MIMDKIEFNSLSIEEQVNIFNKNLFEGKTINKICDELNMSYNTIRDRFKRHNFTYNKYIKQYECSNFNCLSDESLLEKALDKMVNKIFNNQIEPQILVCNGSGETTNRSFRVYTETLNRFTEYCSKSNYNQYDILSKFIEEGMQKYKN